MKIRFGIAITIILVSLFVLAFGISNEKNKNSILVIDLIDLLKGPEHLRKREVRVRGYVKIGSILRYYGDQVNFVMEQGNRQLDVAYRGKTQLPDTFSDGAPIRVDGRLDSDNRFLAERIEAKCASKYEVPLGLEK